VLAEWLRRAAGPSLLKISWNCLWAFEIAEAALGKISPGPIVAETEPRASRVTARSTKNMRRAVILASLPFGALGLDFGERW
jgi:hypothetical protein